MHAPAAKEFVILTSLTDYNQGYTLIYTTVQFHVGRKYLSISLTTALCTPEHQPMQINPDIVVFVRVGSLHMDISCLFPGIVLAHGYYTQN